MQGLANGPKLPNHLTLELLPNKNDQDNRNSSRVFKSICHILAASSCSFTNTIDAGSPIEE